MGIPKTGVFGLIDLVGIDLGPHVNASLRRLLPKSDVFHAMNRDIALIEALIAQGYTGRKGKGGFYCSIARAGWQTRQNRAESASRGQGQSGMAGFRAGRYSAGERRAQGFEEAARV